jgi:hypothetical protein
MTTERNYTVRFWLFFAFAWTAWTVPALAQQFITKAEATSYLETPNYQETIDYLKMLERESRWVRLEQFGTTPLGRPMYIAMVSSDRAFTPEAVRHEGKLIVLIQNGIHSGEIDGKDACLALIRDMAITKERAALLDHVMLVIIPVYNIDGHEMASPYNRINQNGPSQMGFRATSQNFNLNRDYMKADAPETQAFVRLWNRWEPDLFIDNHVTDGADFQYAVTYTITRHDNAAPSVRDWGRDVFTPIVTKKMTAMNEPIFPYVTVTGATMNDGLVDFVEIPRFSTGYAAARNRPGLLVEMHMLKDYKRRVIGNYRMMVAVLETLNEQPAALRNAVVLADSLATLGLREPVSLSFKRTKTPDTVDFLGYPWRVRKSEISGGEWVEYNSTKPQTLRVPYFNTVEPTVTVMPPYAYLIPPQWTALVEKLDLHDVEIDRLREARTLEVETYRLDSVKWSKESFEGHHLVECKPLPHTERVAFPAGTIMVRTAQPAARLIMHALEPGGPDSFLRWGFFDAILEQKEYAESYAAEALAAKMLAEDPKLKTEFDARVAADTAFANSPDARWDFFYKRSPYAEPMLRVYPVGRLMKPDQLTGMAIK